MHSSGETYGKNTSKKSSNCHKTRSYPNFILMWYWGFSNENNTCISLKQKKNNRCNSYVKSTRCLAMKRWLEKRGWIRSKARIGPVLNIKICYPHEQHSVEVQVPSLCWVNTVSWVRSVNGVDRYVTESMPTAKEENTASGKPIAKAWRRQKLTATLTSISNPFLERTWINIETQRSNDQKFFEVAKAITRLLRHDQSVPRGIDGAIHYNNIMEECRRKKFDDPSQRLLEDWISKLAKGGVKKRFWCCVNPNSSNQFLYLRTVQGHSGESAIVPALQDNVLLPKGFFEYVFHVGNANELNFYDKKWMNSRKNQPQKRKTSSLLHNSESDGGRIWLGRNPLRSDKTSDHATQEYCSRQRFHNLFTKGPQICFCNCWLIQKTKRMCM